MPVAPGEVVNLRYRVDTLIGQGGMGAVYRAWDLVLNITVALKENLDTSESAQKQFNEEALILARLNHPGLPRVIDYFSIPGQGEYLVMDFVEGSDLEDTLEKNGGLYPSPGISLKHLDEAQVIPWMLKILDILDYLHHQQPPVIHRDIKPGNIKITSEGRVVLVDFGIAKRYSTTHSTLTGAHAVSPGYSPPEQYGASTTDPRSDLYALGATIYHLITGQKPAESVQRMTGSVKMISPRQINTSMSQDLEQVIIKSLAIPMDNRYQSAAQMQSALSSVLNISTVNPNRSGQVPLQSQSLPVGSQSPPSPGIAAQNAALSHAGRIPGAGSPGISGGYSSIAPQLPAQKNINNRLPLILFITFVAIASGMILIRALLRPGQSQSETTNMSTYSPLPTPPKRELPTMTPPSRILTPLAMAPIENTPAGATPTIPAYPVYIYDLFQFPRIDWESDDTTGLSCRRKGDIFACDLPARSANNYWLRPDGIDLLPGFILSTEIELPKDNPTATAGLIFRDSSAGRYLFSVNGEGQYRVSSIQDDPSNWINLIEWTSHDGIKTDELNLLQVIADSTSYSFFVNHQFLARLDDSSWINGGPGIYLFAATDNKPATFNFNNFEIRQK